MAKADLYPITIIADRYTGSYSGGSWIAFQCFPDEIPSDPFDSDHVAERFWDSVRAGNCEGYPFPIGVGKCPDEALSDLEKKVLE